MKQQRNRNTIALSEDGKVAVLNAMGKKRLNQTFLAHRALVSVSTIKRFLSGKAIDVTCFYSLLASLSLEIQDSYIVKKLNPLNAILVVENQPTNSLPGVFMTGVFTKDKRPQVERILNHLRELLIDGGKVRFGNDGDSVVVRGEFSETNRKHIEMTISELDEIMDSLKVTW